MNIFGFIIITSAGDRIRGIAEGRKKQKKKTVQKNENQAIHVTINLILPGQNRTPNGKAARRKSHKLK
jgi:hypothetical protein